MVLSFSIPSPYEEEGKDKTTSRKIYLLNKGNYDTIRNEFNAVDWNTVLHEQMSVEESWNAIEGKILELKEKYIPQRYVQNNGPNRIKSVPKTVLEKIRLKRQTFKFYKKYRTPENY